MTIDEAIAHAREMAKDNRSICTVTDKGCDKFSKCLQCAEEHEQLAEWLEELQSYKQGNCTNDCEHFDNGVKYGYNKAIDDFVKKLEEHQQENWIDNLEYGITWNDIEQVAEQLKAGGTDGRNQ